MAIYAELKVIIYIFAFNKKGINARLLIIYDN